VAANRINLQLSPGPLRGPGNPPLRGGEALRKKMMRHKLFWRAV